MPQRPSRALHLPSSTGGTAIGVPDLAGWVSATGVPAAFEGPPARA